MRIWAEPFTKLRVPKIFNLRSDPYERAEAGCRSISGNIQGVSAQPAAVELLYRPVRRENAEEL